MMEETPLVSSLISGAAAFNLCAAFLHLWFSKFFRWAEDLPRLSSVNQSVVRVMNRSIASMLALLGITLLVTETPTPFLAMLTAFWMIRASLQPIHFGTAGRMNRLVFITLIAGAVLHAAALVAIASQ